MKEIVFKFVKLQSLNKSSSSKGLCSRDKNKYKYEKPICNNKGKIFLQRNISDYINKKEGKEKNIRQYKEINKTLQDVRTFHENFITPINKRKLKKNASECNVHNKLNIKPFLDEKNDLFIQDWSHKRQNIVNSYRKCSIDLNENTSFKVPSNSEIIPTKIDKKLTKKGMKLPLTSLLPLEINKSIHSMSKISFLPMTTNEKLDRGIKLNQKNNQEISNIFSINRINENHKDFIDKSIISLSQKRVQKGERNHLNDKSKRSRNVSFDSKNTSILSGLLTRILKEEKQRLLLKSSQTKAIIRESENSVFGTKNNDLNQELKQRKINRNEIPNATYQNKILQLNIQNFNNLNMPFYQTIKAESNSSKRSIDALMVKRKNDEAIHEKIPMIKKIRVNKSLPRIISYPEFENKCNLSYISLENIQEITLDKIFPNDLSSEKPGIWNSKELNETQNNTNLKTSKYQETRIEGKGLDSSSISSRSYSLLPTNPQMNIEMVRSAISSKESRNLNVKSKRDYHHKLNCFLQIVERNLIHTIKSTDIFKHIRKYAGMKSLIYLVILIVKNSRFNHLHKFILILREHKFKKDNDNHSKAMNELKKYHNNLIKFKQIAFEIQNFENIAKKINLKLIKCHQYY